jgi:hypothetical protein
MRAAMPKPWRTSRELFKRLQAENPGTIRMANCEPYSAV